MAVKAGWLLAKVLSKAPKYCLSRFFFIHCIISHSGHVWIFPWEVNVTVFIILETWVDFLSDYLSALNNYHMMEFIILIVFYGVVDSTIYNQTTVTEYT